jgi:rfaE bifunctional protein nucleotidyltransferase chain/domain
MIKVFTNGCFDILHAGHIELLEKAKSFGDYLIVGLNSDISVRKLKGEGRPIMPEFSRKRVLEAMEFVDEVIMYDDPSVLETIKEIKPDILVKGGDYKLEDIVGSEFVLSYGGEVKIIDLFGDYSSTKYINKLKK